MTTDDLTTAASAELAAMVPRVAAAVAACPPAPPADAALDLDAASLVSAYRDGVFAPGDVVDACLDRIDADHLGAIWAVDRAGALSAAEHSTARWRAGSARRLEGVPIVVKDLLDTAGLVTTGGSRWLSGRVPTADAAAVATVRAAGAVVVAKSATYELGCGDHEIPFGPVHNPWDPTRITGGSSAGSAAALAARLAPLALGTDTGGSIRIPSAWCGTVGLKPTLGRVPTAGLIGLAPTLDAVGPMARTAVDASLLFAALSGMPAAPVAASLRGRRIGVLGGWFSDVLADDVARTFDEANAVLRALGAELVVVDIAIAGHGGPLCWLITMTELARTYADAPRERLSPAFRRRLEVGERIDAVTYEDALRARRMLTAAVLDAVAGCDVVVTPTCVSTAPPFVDVDRPVAGVDVTWPDVSARMVALWNVTGLPALTVPIGFGTDGLPIGMQVIGRPWADERCLSISAAFQAATGHHLRSPVSRKATL